MKQQGVPYVHNGNQVIMFVDNSKYKELTNKQDLPSMYSWYKDNPEANHLGLMKSWNQKTIRTSGFYDDLITSKSILEVNGLTGGFTYDILVEDIKGCYTTKDMSYQKYAGIDGDKFKIVLNKEFKAGETLTYDVQDGQQIIVDYDEPVLAVAEGFEHTVLLVTNDKNTWFPEYNLIKGVEYFTIDHAVDGERGTHFGGFQFADTSKTMKCEFSLGHVRGVEAYITAAAGKKSFSGAAATSKEFLNQALAEFGNNDFAVIADMKLNASGQKVPNTQSIKAIGETMMYLTLRELQNKTNRGLMWQKGGTINNTHGVTKISEGLWHQFKRGRRIKYAKPGGMEKQHLIEAGNYIFQGNPDLPYFERRLKFECGHEAFQNILRIFKEEIVIQNSILSATGMLGADRMTPNPVGNLNDPMNLSYGTIRFTKVFIEGLGHLEIEHNASLDRMDQGVDRFHKGMHPNGFSRTTYSVMITDCSNQTYSNNKELPKGTKLIDGGDEGANIFLVKPEGEMTYWGYRNGRYSSRKAGDIASSMKEMGEESWAWNSCAAWVKDPTKVLMIELAENVARGFN